MNSNKTTIFSKISNLIFLTLAIFILTFIWINFYYRSFRKSLVIALFLSIIFFIFYLIFTLKQSKKNKYINTSNNQLLDLKTQILYGNNKSTIKCLKNAFNLKSLELYKENKYIDKENKCDIVFIFDKENLIETDFIDIYKDKHYNHIKIFCINTETKIILNNCNIEIINIEQINQQLNKCKINLNNDIKLKVDNKPNFKEVLRTVFNKNKSKSYFWFGLLLMISSLFTIFSIYYITIGSILLLLSIYSRFNKKFN